LSEIDFPLFPPRYGPSKKNALVLTAHNWAGHAMGRMDELEWAGLEWDAKGNQLDLEHNEWSGQVGLD
jgi:hypothetical protein